MRWDERDRERSTERYLVSQRDRRRGAVPRGVFWMFVSELVWHTTVLAGCGVKLPSIGSIWHQQTWCLSWPEPNFH